MKILNRKIRFYFNGSETFRQIKTKVKNYCKNTSLHGFSYIVKDEKFSYKSCFWILVCAFCVGLCTWFIYFQLLRYQNNRVTTTITTANYPIWNVPFPAVTVCNFNVVYRDNMKEFLEILGRHKISEKIVDDYFLNLSSVILNDELVLDEVDWNGYKVITDTLEKEGYNTEKLMEKLAQPCSSMLQSCTWKTKEIDCNSIFRLVKTSNGFCCSFNYHGDEFRQKQEKAQNIYVNGVGSNFGLLVNLNLEESQYMSSTKSSYGFNVLVHDPHEYPDMSVYNSYVYPGTRVSYGMKPTIISSKSEIRNIDVQTRGCIFDDEENLLWTNYYTFNTCLIQCKVKFMWALCGCIPFFYPITFFKYSQKYCTIMDLICLNKAEKMFTAQRVINTGEKFDNNRYVCNCKQQCNEVNYEHNKEQEAIIPMVGFDSTPTNLSTLVIHFSNAGCAQFVRAEYLTWDSLLASVGGIFGLFLGGSIVSIIEFFYHITLWLLGNVCIFNKMFKRNKVKKYEAKIYLSELYPKRNPKEGNLKEANQEILVVIL